MYENITYEALLQRMIDRVKVEYPNLDTREGSIIFNALAPAAIELAIAYTELDNIRSESFVATASRTYVLTACQQMGMDISVFEASYGTHKGEFDVEVSIGSRWNCDLYNYTVTEYNGLENGYYSYQLECETAGAAPNKITGDLTPITEMPTGLSHAKLVECLIEGEDRADDDTVRASYFNYVSASATDGNLSQYKYWCDNYDGIGNSKIIPLWNGANTVKVSVLSASNGVASDELIDEFQEYLDPNSEGMGNGVAPIGAFVTVTTATEKEINITADIKLISGYTDTSVIDTAITKYFSQLAYTKTTVPYMNIGAVILGSGVVESVNNLQVNGGTADITLGEEEIPVLGTATWTVT